jgi:hypothetical protein
MQPKGIPQQDQKDFQRLKAEVNGIMRKIGEFESQRDEHAYDYSSFIAFLPN